jgi:hypothetical protein
MDNWLFKFFGLLWLTVLLPIWLPIALWIEDNKDIDGRGMAITMVISLILGAIISYLILISEQ